MSVVARLIGARFELSELVPERGASEMEPFLGGRKIEAREESRLLGSDSGSSVMMASAPSFLEVNHCPIDLEILTLRVSDLSIFPERGKWRLGQRVMWQRGGEILQPMFISAMRNFFHVQRYFPPWTFRMTSLSSSNLVGGDLCVRSIRLRPEIRGSSPCFGLWAHVVLCYFVPVFLWHTSLDTSFLDLVQPLLYGGVFVGVTVENWRVLPFLEDWLEVERLDFKRAEHVFRASNDG